MQFIFSLKAKGPRGLAARAGTIASRFGPTSWPMDRYLKCYSDLLAEFGARPTLPITARVLARHPQLIQKYVERGVEFAIHGLVHNDHAVLSLNRQCQTIAQAMEIFETANVPYTGFRGPYLRYNQATNDAVRALGLKYHSSQAVAFEVLPQKVEQSPNITGYQRALQLYRALDADQVAVRPRAWHGLIHIPVVIPDDEIMVDRLHLDQQTQSTIWLAILEATYTRGDLFTMQLHPERIFDCAHALRAMLQEARMREPAIWIATLDEIASWWLLRQQAALTVEQLESDRYRIDLEAASEATLLVRWLPTAEVLPWYGHDRVAQQRSFEVTSTVKPVIGVSSRSSNVALDFLREEGFPVEISDDRQQFGVFVDIPSAEFDEVGLLAEIERSPGPLVRLGRWPSAARSALAVTGDMDSITLQDFALRLWETRR